MASSAHACLPSPDDTLVSSAVLGGHTSVTDTDRPYYTKMCRNSPYIAVQMSHLLVTWVSPAKTSWDAIWAQGRNHILDGAYVWVLPGKYDWMVHAWWQCGLLLPLPLNSFNSLFSRTTWVSWYQKGRTIVDFKWSKRWWSGSDISWTTCKSFALCSRQTTTPAPHHPIFMGPMLFLTPNQQC